MPRAKKTLPKNLIKATADATRGATLKELSTDPNISERTARWIKRAAGLSVEQYRDEVLADLRTTHGMMARRLRDEVDKLSTSQLPVSLAVIQDKISALTGERPAPTTQINVQINGVERSKAEIIQGLFGNAVGAPTPVEQANKT
jgi:TusA-related sulfurtransferase